MRVEPIEIEIEIEIGDEKSIFNDVEMEEEDPHR
jgi:hypothetical protein